MGDFLTSLTQTLFVYMPLSRHTGFMIKLTIEQTLALEKLKRMVLFYENEGAWGMAEYMRKIMQQILEGK